MYKTSLAREYRQLCVDPLDWPLLCLRHGGECYMDLGPLSGIKTAAMCMQRTSEVLSYIHGLPGFVSEPYLDNLGDSEATFRQLGRR